jgi:hypothetical protein
VKEREREGDIDIWGEGIGAEKLEIQIIRKLVKKPKNLMPEPCQGLVSVPTDG